AVVGLSCFRLLKFLLRFKFRIVGLVGRLLLFCALFATALEQINQGQSERNIKQCKRKICDGHYTAAVRVLSSSGVAPYTDATLDDLKAKHPFNGAVVAISDELITSIAQVVNLFLDGKCPKMLGEYIASAPLTPLVKPGGIRPIAVGTGFGVGVSGGGEAILYAVNRLIEDRSDDIGLSMLLVDFKNAFNLVDREVMLQEVRIRCPAISRWVEFCYSNPTRLYYGNTPLWSHQGVQQGDPLGPLLFALVLHPLIRKIKDSFSLSLHAWYLDDGTIIGDTLVVGKVLELIMEDGPRCGLHLNVDKTERVAKSIELMDVIAKLNDPQCELLLLRAVRLYSASLQSKLPLLLVIVSFGLAFDSTLNAFNVKMEIDPLSNPSEIAALKLIKKLADIYFTSVTQMAESTFFLSTRQMALWKSQMEDHTSDWLRVVPISGLGQTMNACSRVFMRDIYGDHAVSCAGIVGIKHRHNVVRDTLVDICYRSGISSGKEVDIGLGGEPPHTTKRVKYEAKLADNLDTVLLPFLFSSFGDLEKRCGTPLLKRIQKFPWLKDIGA
ncbi:putative reverse transcriptase domain-containing protein, partial [Tanacetum coccineum]